MKIARSTLAVDLPSSLPVQPSVSLTHFEGSTLLPCPPLSAQADFVGRFLGPTLTFQSAGRTLLFRQANRGTRRLQSSESCLRDSGYLISHRQTDSDNWVSYFAQHRDEAAEVLHIREQISDGRRHWSAPSNWFWHAVLHPHSGPWFATTVITPLAPTRQPSA